MAKQTLRTLEKSTNAISKKRDQTAQRIIKAIKNSEGGLLTAVAERAKLNYSTVWRYARDYPSVKEALQEAKEKLLDFAESKLYTAIKKGELVAILFFLKTKGKARGYTERQEIVGADGKPMEVQIYLPENYRDIKTPHRASN